MTLGFFEAWKVILHIKKGWGGLDNRPLICYHTLRTYPLEGCSPAEPSSVSDRAAKIRFYLSHKPSCFDGSYVLSPTVFGNITKEKRCLKDSGTVFILLLNV